MQKNIKYWLAINKVPNLGPITIKKLWDHFGSAEEIWKASEGCLLEIEGLNKKAVKSFIENRNRIDLENEIKAVSKEKLKILSLEDKDYPELLKNIYDPPPVLYIKGRNLKSNDKTVAIVGTRRASRYGKEIAQKLAFELASLGITIVSGMASGIDTSAHKGALEAKGNTIAVFGCGVDVIFPSENRSLASEIESSGALVSEFPLGTGAEKGNFPRRNRIISGLSLGVIVVEGHYDSGAMITAKSALDQGREVFALPGKVDSQTSFGTNGLIKQGAKLVSCLEDILEEFNMPLVSCDKFQEADTPESKPIPKQRFNYEESLLYNLVSEQPIPLDEIVQKSHLSISSISSIILRLQMKKLIKQLPRKQFIRCQ